MKKPITEKDAGQALVEVHASAINGGVLDVLNLADRGTGPGSPV
jgi:hypothetical protein